MSTRKLIASAPTQDALLLLLKQFFCSEVTLQPCIDGSFDVLNSRGKIVGIAVRNYKRRWRAEVTE